MRGAATLLPTCLHDVVFNKNGGRLSFIFSMKTYFRTTLFFTILKNLNSHIHAPAVLNSRKEIPTFFAEEVVEGNISVLGIEPRFTVVHPSLYWLRQFFS